MLDADGLSTAFGLSIRELDNRQMQHILRAHSRLADGPATRPVLYLALVALERSLADDEAQKIRDWLSAGGVLSEFPGPAAAQGPPINGDSWFNYTDSAWYSPPQNSSPHNGHFPTGTTAAADTTGQQATSGSDWPFLHAVSEDVHEHTGVAEGEDDEDDLVDDDEDSDEDEDSDDYMEGQDQDEQASNTNNPVDQSVSNNGYADGQPALENKVPEGWKECCICACQLAPVDFPETTKITATCAHDHEEMVCIECIRRSLQEALSVGETRRIGCLMCREYFKPEDVKKYGTEEIISRYEHLVFMATPGLVMCLGPHCGAGQVHPENHKENPVMICSSCGFKTCTVHKLPWHEGFSCEEFDCDESQIERLEADEATAKLLSQNSKICPACNQGVTKTDGCDHLQCRCGQEWCFECLTSWDNIMRMGDTAHARHCSYHPDKVNLRSDQQAANARNMAELVHGGPVSEALANARIQHNAKRRETLRPLALEAAEKRAKAMKEEVDARAKERDAGASGSLSGGAPRKKPKLLAAWEEK